MRRLSAPTEKDEVALKKIGRYLLGNPRLVSTFKYGESVATLTVEGDSDHAGCIRTRKSTSGGVIRWWWWWSWWWWWWWWRWWWWRWWWWWSRSRSCSISASAGAGLALALTSILLVVSDPF